MSNIPIQPVESGGKTALRMIALIVVVLFILLLVIGSNHSTPKKTPLQACEEQYGGPGEAANECALRLLSEQLREMDKDKLDRARQESGH